MTTIIKIYANRYPVRSPEGCTGLSHKAHQVTTTTGGGALNSTGVNAITPVSNLKHMRRENKSEFQKEHMSQET
tara:strand:+ start:253 stop:474 length:222 start_codon:yes stop_codon:yes gene_type:complete